MTFRVPVAWVYNFVNRILREAQGFTSEPDGDCLTELDESDLESMIYEAGERNWEEDDDGFYYIAWDD